jgi:hypothetical protein
MIPPDCIAGTRADQKLNIDELLQLDKEIHADLVTP